MPVLAYRVGEHVGEHRVVVEGSHERSGGDWHVLWAHQVDLGHREHGSCAPVSPGSPGGNPPIVAGVGLHMTSNRFSVNWDYRCPFARNAHEHVVAALQDGAPYEVEFVPFSLNQAHVAEGGTPVWDDPERDLDLLAGQVGIVVRDKFPAQFLHAHLALFALRHDKNGDLRDRAALSSVLQSEGIDPARVFEEIKSGWPLDELRKSHEAAVADHLVFGVPTFVAGDQAAFVRIMTRPANDPALARATVQRILDLLENHVELNEFKRTSIPR